MTRWGSVRVAIGRRLLLVTGDEAGDQTCALCGRPSGALHCRFAGRDACVGCAVEAAAPEPASAATLGVGAMAPAAPHAGRLTHSGVHGSRGDAMRPSLAKRRQ